MDFYYGKQEVLDVELPGQFADVKSGYFALNNKIFSCRLMSRTIFTQHIVFFIPKQKLSYKVDHVAKYYYATPQINHILEEASTASSIIEKLLWERLPRFQQEAAEYYQRKYEASSRVVENHLERLRQIKHLALVNTECTT